MKTSKHDSSSYDSFLEPIIEHGFDGMVQVIATLMNEAMKIERERHIGASPYEHSQTRNGHANGYKKKMMHTRSGPMELDVPQVRDSREGFYPRSLEKGTRSERALKYAVAEMYVQGVSTRKVEAITKELCGFEISSTEVSRCTKIMDEELEKFRQRSLGEFSYVMLDAHYEKIRHNGCIRSLAILKAVGVNKDGYREILGVSASLSEAEVHWRDFFKNLQTRGLHGVLLFTSDDHAGLKSALSSVFPSVPLQRCQFHLAQNAQHYAPKKAMREPIAQAVRDIFNAPDRSSAKEQVRRTIEKYKEKAPEFVNWLEENIEEGFTCYNFPKKHQKKIRTVNMLERLHREIRRRTRVATLFPNTESCLRLITAVLVEKHEDWVTGRRYLDMSLNNKEE